MKILNGKTKILVHTPLDEIVFLEYSKDRSLVLYDNEEVSKGKMESVVMKYSLVVGKSDKTQMKDLEQEVHICVKPILTTRKPYASGMDQIPDPPWPISSEGWYGRMIGGESRLCTLFKVFSTIRNT